MEDCFYHSAKNKLVVCSENQGKSTPSNDKPQYFSIQYIYTNIHIQIHIHNDIHIKLSLQLFLVHTKKGAAARAGGGGCYNLTGCLEKQFPTV